MKFINKYVKSIEITGIRRFFNKVSEVNDAVSMTVGQPDFPVPDAIKEAMVNGIGDNQCNYTKNEGKLELREEISKYLKSQMIEFNSGEICVTAGGSEGIYSTFAAITEAEDVFLVPDPAYPAYDGCIKMMGGISANYSLTEEFQPNFEHLEELLKNEKVKGIVISYPCNPTGATLNEDSFNRLVEILKKRDIIVISDEMYSSIIYKDENYRSLAQVEELKNRVVLIGGFSKIFSMTGLRVGYICAEAGVLDKIKVVHQHNTTCANSIAQLGAEAGLKYCMDEVPRRSKILKERRDFVCRKLKKLGFAVNIPDGAFYVFAKMPECGLTSEEFCSRLLYEGKVALVPGDAFGINGEGFVRVSYSYSMEQLVMAFDRIEGWMRKNNMI